MSKDTSNNPFWGDNFASFKGLRFPWANPEIMLSNYRRNMELINTTQQIAAETTKAVIQLQAQYMKDVFDQLSEQAKQNISTISPEDKVIHQSENTKATFDQAIDHARSVNSLIAQSSDKIIENVQKRFKETVDESAALAKKAKTK